MAGFTIPKTPTHKIRSGREEFSTPVCCRYQQLVKSSVAHAAATATSTGARHQLEPPGRPQPQQRARSSPLQRGPQVHNAGKRGQARIQQASKFERASCTCGGPRACGFPPPGDAVRAARGGTAAGAARGGVEERATQGGLAPWRGAEAGD